MGTLIESSGLKRLIASLLSVTVEVLRSVHGTAEYVSIIEVIAGVFGITGISHATLDGNLTRKKLATASAATASLILLTFFIPALVPFRPYLQQLAALLGAGALGAQAKQAEVVKKEDVESKNISSI